MLKVKNPPNKKKEPKPQPPPSPPPSPAPKSTDQPKTTTQEKPATEPKKPEKKTEERQFPAGSYIVRMDQPYSRIADALLDYQYWSPSDPQTDIYDDTAWTMGELGNVEVVRVTDTKVLEAAMERVSGEVRSPGEVNSSGSVYLINHNADNTLATLRYRLKNVAMETAEE